jgi:hypothetical protein
MKVQIATAALKNRARLKSGHKRLKNDHLALLVKIRDTLNVIFWVKPQSAQSACLLFP